MNGLYTIHHWYGGRLISCFTIKSGSFTFCVPGIVKSLIQPYILIQVPVAAAVYYDDMYVNFKLALDTASQIAGIRPWITNEYMHSGLRDGGGQVLGHLLGMLKGKKPLF